MECPYLCTETVVRIRMGSHCALVPQCRLKPTSILQGHHSSRLAYRYAVLHNRSLGVVAICILRHLKVSICLHMGCLSSMVDCEVPVNIVKRTWQVTQLTHY